MKKIIISFISLFIAFNLCGQESNEKNKTVQKIEEFNNLFSYHNLYIGGQPTIEELRWLRSKGVTKIINLRSEEENKEYSGYAYNEKNIVEELGFEYHNIQVNGMKDYSPEKLVDVSSQLNTNDKILLHCLSGGRATYFLMAYLIKNKGFSLNEAAKLGKNIKYSNPLEQLLGIEIVMDAKTVGLQNN